MLAALAIACGRTALHDAEPEADGGATAAPSGGSSTAGGARAEPGMNGGTAPTAGAGGGAPLPSAGTPPRGGVAGEGGAAQGGAMPDPPVVVDFLELTGNCSPLVRDIARAPNGDLALAGNYCETLSLDEGEPVLDASDGLDGFVLVLDDQRRVRWARHFGGMFGESVYAVTFLPNGHVFAKGRAADRTGFGAELDAQGELVWSSKSAGAEELLPGEALFDESVGLTEVGGERPILDAFPPWGDWQMYLRRLNEHGEELSFQRSTISGRQQAFASHAASAGLGDLVLGGWSTVGEHRSAFVRKLSGPGDELFTTSIEATAAIELTGLAVDRRGATFVAGAFQGRLTLGAGELSSGSDENSAEWLAKLDSAGAPQWVRGSEVGAFSKLTSLDLDGAGHIVVSGVNERGLFVRQLSSQGKAQWSLELEATKVTSLRVIVDGPQQLVLSGEATGVRFGSRVSRDGAPFLMTLRRR